MCAIINFYAVTKIAFQQFVFLAISVVKKYQQMAPETSRTIH